MANYDFRSPSPHDFELLCQDLLQEVPDVRLQSFTTGRGSSIDCRDRRQGVDLILQCKHSLQALAHERDGAVAGAQCR